MQLLSFHPAERRPINRFESHGAAWARLARGRGELTVVTIALQPGGVLGRHPTDGDQLFLVIEGDGQVSGADGRPQPIAAGAAAFWQAGEWHETRAGPGGLVAVVIEGELAGERLEIEKLGD